MLKKYCDFCNKEINMIKRECVSIDRCIYAYNKYHLGIRLETKEICLDCNKRVDALLKNITNVA